MKNYYDLKIDLKGWKLRKKQLEKQIQELELIVSNTSNTSNENQKTYVGNSTEKKYITYIDLKIKYKKELNKKELLRNKIGALPYKIRFHLKKLTKKL